MDHLSEIFIVAIVFAGLYGALKLFIRRKERLMIIEKGIDSPDIKSDSITFSSLKFGLFFAGIGIGVLVANILIAVTIIEPEVAYFSLIFLFGGIALIIHHFIEKNQK